MEVHLPLVRMRRNSFPRWVWFGVGCLMASTGSFCGKSAWAQGEDSPVSKGETAEGSSAARNLGVDAASTTPLQLPVAKTPKRNREPAPSVNAEARDSSGAAAVAGSAANLPVASVNVDYGPPEASAVPSAATSPGTLPSSAASASVPAAQASARVGDGGVPGAASASSAVGQRTAPLVSKVYPTVEVKVRDVLVLKLKLADGGLVPAERAKRATRAIEAALADSTLDSVRSELRADRALLLVGNRPIVELTRDDAEIMGEGSLELYAASAAARVRDVLDNERRQSVVANTLLNIVLVGALAVGVVLALRWLGLLARKVQRFVQQNPERIPAIRLQSIEVVGPHVLRSAVVVGVGVVKLLLQFAVAYSWLVFSSSLFDATKGLAGKLTSLVLSPLGGLMTRIAALLPLVLVTAIAVAALFVLLRFIELFFVAVQRRETELSWLRPELAAPTSLLVRVGLLVASLLFLAPVVTGNLEGALTRLGMLFVVTVALASIPLLANVVVGFVTLYGARLTEGDWVQLGESGERALQGSVKSLGLLELKLLSEGGREIRVAYLSTLFRPLSIRTAAQPVSDEAHLLVEAQTTPERLLDVLRDVMKREALTGSVELVRLSSGTATAVLRVLVTSAQVKETTMIQVAKATAAAELPLVLAEWRERT